MKDRTLLVKNRNFNFDKGCRRISGIGLFDYVKVLNDQQDVSHKKQLTYGLFSSYALFFINSSICKVNSTVYCRRKISTHSLPMCTIRVFL